MNTATEPTSTSPVFPDSLLVTSSSTINIKAFKTGLLDSENNTGRFNIGVVPPIPEVYPESGTYANPFTFYVDRPEGTSVFRNWTTDGSEPVDPATGTGYEFIYNHNGVTIDFDCTYRIKIRSWKDNQYSDLVERTFIVKPGFRIAQIDDEVVGDSSFGNWSLWNVNKWKVMPDTVLIRPSTSIDYIIKAMQDYKPTTFRKYKVWRRNLIYDNYVNHAQISIDNNTSSVLAYFNNVANVTVLNKVDNVSSYNTGFFYLKDPWFVDDSSDSKGIRNHGLDPLPVRMNFSVTPNLTTNSSHKGVFLNQGADWQPPYYSVKVDAVQDVSLTNTGVPTGRTHKFYFQNWSGTNVNLQNANNLETPVVFTLDGAMAQANLKGTQLTNTSFSDARSGQRGFIKDNYNGYLHNVYESMGKIWYERSTNNGDTWTLMNNGAPINPDGNAKSPSICENKSYNLLYIVYQGDTFPFEGLVITQYGPGVNDITPKWTQPICPMSDFNYSNDYQPVIASMGDGGVVICNPPSTSTAGLRAFNFTTDWVYHNYTGSTEFSIPSSQNSSNPSIAADCQRFHLVFDEAKIKY